jgi:hypothetical protein
VVTSTRIAISQHPALVNARRRWSFLDRFALIGRSVVTPNSMIALPVGSRAIGIDITHIAAFPRSDAGRIVPVRDAAPLHRIDAMTQFNNVCSITSA